MRERAKACGGTLAAGPTDVGGWQVAAYLPAIQAATARTTPNMVTPLTCIKPATD